MALNVAQGTVALRTTVGLQTIWGLSFNPAVEGVKSVLLLWWGRATADGSAASGSMGFGAAISSSSRRCAHAGFTDQNSLKSGVKQSNTHCMAIMEPDSQWFDTLVRVDFDSWTTDGFKLDVEVTNGTAWVLHYQVLSGSDLTYVELGSGTCKTSTGTKAFTTAAKPDCVLLFGSARSTSENVEGATWQQWKFGVATSASSRWAMGAANREVVVTAECDRKQLSTVCLIGLASTSGSGYEEYRADLDSFNETDFTLDFEVAPSSAQAFFWLALAGPAFSVATADQPTSTGSQDITTTGVDPALALLASFCNAATTGMVANFRASLGGGISSSARGCVWSGYKDATSTPDGDRDHDTAAIIKLLTEGTPTLDAEADLDSLGSGKFTLDWVTVDGTARQFCSLAIGTTGGTPVSNSFSCAIESTGRIAGTVQPPLESLQPIGAAAGAPIESATGLATEISAAIEATGRAAREEGVPLEAAGRVAAEAVAPHEALLAIAREEAAPVEAAQGVAEGGSIPYEAQGSADSVENSETVPIEALGRAAAESSAAHESLQPVATGASAPYEAAAGVAAAASVPIESTGYVVVLVLPPLEATGRVAAEAAPPYEALGQAIPVAAVLAIPIEALGRVTRSLAPPFEAEGKVLSIRERIFLNIAATLGSIKLANGFGHDVAEVRRVNAIGFRLRGYPGIVVREGTSQEEELASGATDYQDARIDFEIGLWTREFDDLPEEANALLLDVERALLVDPTRGGLAVDTEIRGNTLVVAAPTQPFATHVVRVSVLERHDLRDPMAAAGIAGGSYGVFPILAPAQDQALSARERIVRDLVAAIEGIAGLAGVPRMASSPHDMPDFPSVIVVEGGESKGDGVAGPVGLITSEFEVMLFVWERDLDGERLPAEVNAILAEVKRAVLADPGRGGDALSTRVMGTVQEVDESGQPFGLHRVTVRITYRHDRLDPTRSR